jgi:predicted glycosyl hydrolase (DUF1957 family)
MPGYLALILHAHLPFVRHPEHEYFLEEDWLFEALTETYIPLLGMMQRLVNDGVPFKITMSITPTLCAMLRDELLRQRYVRHLDLLIDLSAREKERNRHHPKLSELADFYFEISRKADVSLSSNGNAICLPLFANCVKRAYLKSLLAPPPTASFLFSNSPTKRARRF